MTTLNPSAGVVQLDKHGDYSYTVTSKPYPLAYATVRRKSTWEWAVRITSDLIPGPVRFHATRELALAAAASMVSRRVAELWREGGPLNGAQRYAVGQQQCPYWMKSHVCGQAPEPGTVWCSWHPKGKRKDVGL